MKLNFNELTIISNALQHEYDRTKLCFEPEICYQISENEKERLRNELNKIDDLKTKILIEMIKELE